MTLAEISTNRLTMEQHSTDSKIMNRNIKRGPKSDCLSVQSIYVGQTYFSSGERQLLGDVTQRSTDVSKEYLAKKEPPQRKVAVVLDV